MATGVNKEIDMLVINRYFQHYWCYKKKPNPKPCKCCLVQQPRQLKPGNPLHTKPPVPFFFSLFLFVLSSHISATQDFQKNYFLLLLSWPQKLYQSVKSSDCLFCDSLKAIKLGVIISPVNKLWHSNFLFSFF